MDSHENMLKRTISWIYDYGYDFVRIDNVENKHFGEFQEKKSKLLNETGGFSVCSEILLYADSSKNVAFILSENLDRNKIKKGIYGKGVLFPNNLGDKKIGVTVECKLIICYVFIEKIKNVLFNSEDVDAQDGSGHSLAVVEFEEKCFSFYPIHIVHFMTKEDLQASYLEISSLDSPNNDTHQDVDSNRSPELVTEYETGSTFGFYFDNFKTEKKFLLEIARSVGIEFFHLLGFVFAIYLIALLTFNVLLTSTVVSFVTIFLIHLSKKDDSFRHKLTNEIVPFFFNEYCIDISNRLGKELIIYTGLHTYTVIMLFWFIIFLLCNFTMLCILIGILVFLKLSITLYVGKKDRIMPTVGKKKKNKGKNNKSCSLI